MSVFCPRAAEAAARDLEMAARKGAQAAAAAAFNLLETALARLCIGLESRTIAPA